MIVLALLFLPYIIFKSHSNNSIVKTSSVIEEEDNNYFDSEWKYTENRTTIDAPEIIQNLYNSIENNNSRAFFSNSNIIRCIQTADYKITRSGMMIKFNLTTIQNQEQVVNSEIYVFKYESLLETSYIIRLYRVTSKDRDDDFQELIEITYISSNFQGYLALNLEKSLEKWKDQSHVEFLISITDSRDRKIKFEETGFDIGRKSAFLVAYLFTKSDKIEASLNLAPIQDGYQTNSTCQLTSLEVDFTRDRFRNFILLPRKANLFKCTGYCSLMGSEYTNNAKFRKIYLKDSKSVGVTYCIPNRYKPILIMFLDQLNNIVIKNYKDMIVTSCKCR